MDTYVNKLESIQQKTQRLIASYGSSRQQCTNLQQENDELKAALESQKQLVEELQEKNRLLQISGQLASNSNNGDMGENKELKKQINTFIKEIDKCVALLNN